MMMTMIWWVQISKAGSAPVLSVSGCKKTTFSREAHHPKNQTPPKKSNTTQKIKLMLFEKNVEMLKPCIHMNFVIAGNARIVCAAADNIEMGHFCAKYTFGLYNCPSVSNQLHVILVFHIPHICKIYAWCLMHLLGLSETQYNCVFQIVTNPEKIHAIRYWDHIQMFPDRTRIISWYLCTWAHGRHRVQVFQNEQPHYE